MKTTLNKAVSSAKTLRPRITTIRKGNITKINPRPRVNRKISNNQKLFTKILSNFGLISTIVTYLIKIFGPKSKYFFLFSLGLVIFRKSWRIYLILSGLVIAVIAIVSYFSGENINLSILTVFQILTYPFVGFLDYFNYNFDNLIEWFKNLMKHLANKVKTLESSDDLSGDIKNKNFNIFKQDSDSQNLALTPQGEKEGINFKKYLVYGATALGAIIFISVIYNNKDDLASNFGAFFHSSIDLINNYTPRPFKFVKRIFGYNQDPARDSGENQDDNDDSFVNSVFVLFKKVGSLFKRNRTMTREELERYTQLATMAPHAPPRDLVGGDMPQTIFDVESDSDFNPDHPWDANTSHARQTSLSSLPDNLLINPFDELPNTGETSFDSQETLNAEDSDSNSDSNSDSIPQEDSNSNSDSETPRPSSPLISEVMKNLFRQ